MLGLAVLCLFFLGLYAYNTHNREFEATASAIWQIWTGSCRRSCRQNQYCGLTVISRQENQGAEGEDAGNICVCGTCPCALLEDVLRSCRPATTFYRQSIDVISRGYCNALRVLSDVCNEASRAPFCGVSCVKEAQLLSIGQCGSADNINFINETAVRAESDSNENELGETKEVQANQKREASIGQTKAKKLLEAVVKAEGVQELTKLFKKEEAASKKEELDIGRTSKQTDSEKNESGLAQTSKISQVSRRKEIPLPNESDAGLKLANASKTSQYEVKKYDSGQSFSSVATEDQKSCSKCIEKGKICMGTCPKAKEKGN